MRYLVAQTMCAGKMFWIVRDSGHSWSYNGPFADEATAHAFAVHRPRELWKMAHHEARLKKREAAAQALRESLAA
jgi:hypothetical protein